MLIYFHQFKYFPNLFNLFTAMIMGILKVYHVAVVISLMYAYKCKQMSFDKLDDKYFLVSEAYNLSKNLFADGRTNYNKLKQKSVEGVEIFLDLVKIMNGEMARELRSAVIKFYKIKYFHDFTNYIMSMEEIIDITEHCLREPVEKVDQIRLQFHDVINNFEDVRDFDAVNKCSAQLPDEVAVAHCILHQAVLFNETMQESLVTIVRIKTRQHAQDVNASVYNVQTCFSNFVPNFFDQLMVDAYTNECGYLKVLNASIADLINERWKHNETHFPQKWKPLTQLLKEKLNSSNQVVLDPLFVKLFPDH